MQPGPERRTVLEAVERGKGTQQHPLGHILSVLVMAQARHAMGQHAAPVPAEQHIGSQLPARPPLLDQPDERLIPQLWQGLARAGCLVLCECLCRLCRHR
jgi:hypothetical protein